MISDIHISRFKSLKNVRYTSRRLNVFCGLNGSGKSSLLQAIRLVHSIGSDIQTVQPRVRLNLDDLMLGTQKDAFYSYRENATDDIEIEIRREGETGGIKFHFPFSGENCDYIDCIMELGDGSYPDQLRKLAFMGELEHIRYISANRMAGVQEHAYSMDRIGCRQWGASGENAVGFLAENKLKTVVPKQFVFPKSTDVSLIGQVNAWMSVFSPGLEVHADKLYELNRTVLSLSYMRGADKIRYTPQNVGFGISYVLAVVVALLASAENDILIIENPEAHLHPKGQAELGRLLSLVASRGAQIFVETHSDHIINGIRVAVKKEEISKEDTSVAFFSRRGGYTTRGLPEEFTSIETISIDENGELSNYPDDFLCEWSNQLAKLFE